MKRFEFQKKKIKQRAFNKEIFSLSSDVRLGMIRFRTEPFGLVSSFGLEPNRTETQETEPLKFRFGSVPIGSNPVETDAKRVQKALDLIF